MQWMLQDLRTAVTLFHPFVYKLLSLHLHQESDGTMENEGAYRAVLYTCVAAHWITLLTAVAVVGSIPISPLPLIGAACPCCVP